MLILSLLVGLGLGLLAGGRIANLASVQLRFVQLLFLGLLLRYATQFAIESGNALADELRLPLFAGGFLLLLIGLWMNRDHPGLALAFVGILLNAVAVVTNGGFMPVWEPSIVAAGFPPGELGSAFHVIVGATATGGVGGDFLAQAGPLGDIIPIPLPFIRNVASIGDLFLAAGLAFFLFATTVREPTEAIAAGEAAIRRRLGRYLLTPTEAAAAEAAAMLDSGALVATDGPFFSGKQRPEFDDYDGALVSAAALERPLSLGGPSVGSEGTLRRTGWRAIPGVPPLVERVRRHRVRPPRARRLVQRPVDGPADQRPRRSDPPGRARVRRVRCDPLPHRGRRRVPRRHAAEPAVRADRRRPRRSLGPP